MHKTRRLNKTTHLSKKTKKNRQMYYGGAVPIINSNIVTGIESKREGILDFLKNKVYGLASGTGKYLLEKGERILGVQPIKPADIQQVEQNAQIDGNMNQIGENMNQIVSGVSNTAAGVVDTLNKGAANVLEGVNEVLAAPQIQGTIGEAAEKTEQIAEKLLGTVNDKFDNPELKKEISESLENVAEVATIGIQAIDKPLNSAIDQTTNAVTHAASGILTSGIKVGTDALGAVPYVGAVIELGKMLNDGSKGVSAVVEAGSEAVEAGADLFIDTKKNFEEGLDKLKEEGSSRLNSADGAISEFENQAKNMPNIPSIPSIPSIPKASSVSGGRGTRKRHKKNNKKSKKVKFML